MNLSYNQLKKANQTKFVLPNFKQIPKNDVRT